MAHLPPCRSSAISKSWILYVGMRCCLNIIIVMVIFSHGGLHL